MKTWPLVVIVLALSACGKEMGRVPFTGEGSGTSSVTLKAGEVAFWTDIDISYTGAAVAHYDIELQQGGATVATAKCDPLGKLPTKTSWVETNIGDSHSRSGNGKMTCAVNLPSAGATTVNVKLVFDTKPTTLDLKKADLALRQ
jgi:hypothetical protein